MYDVAYRRRRSPALILFLIGLFSLTQVKIGGKIGISEFFMVISSPFLFFKDLSSLKRDGFLTMINLALLWLVGAAFSDWMNGSVFDQSIRGLSVPVVIFSTVVVIHHFLRDDIRDCKWLLLGLACSLVLSTFVFQRGTAGDMAAEGDMAGAVQKVVGYKLFWSNQIKTWFSLPVQTMYLQMPFAMSMLCVSIVAVASLLRGGRSAFLFALMSLVLLVMGRKNINAMRNVKRHIVLVLGILACIGIGVKSLYKYAGTHGWLNDYETKKFERQTSEGDSVMKLLMAGRGEFFIACFAIVDKPLLGHGSWAVDTKGYVQDFIFRYGSSEDLRMQMLQDAQEAGGLHIIPTHSHITTAWLWHGLPGAIFWFYILYLVYRVFFKCLNVVPELYGYLVLAIPDFTFDIFFSPFGMRTLECLFFVVLCFLSNMEKKQKFNGWQVYGH